MKTIVAIDPGASGGIAYRLDISPEKVISFAMPETEGDILNHLCDISEASLDPCGAIAIVEKVGGFIKGRPAPGSTMFNFGRGFGYIMGVLMALHYRVELVTPQKWQKELSLGKSDGDKTAWKNKLKAEAQRLFPEQKVTLSTADALLLLEFGMRKAGDGR